MSKEFSAGGVVVREIEGTFELAVIRPKGRNTWALPKGHIDPGETPQRAAEREVEEETGLEVSFAGHLGDIRYVYQREGLRIFKTVSFFLFRYRSGEIDRLTEEMRKEVDVAQWVPLTRAEKLLSYAGERDMAKKAITLLSVPKANRR